KPLIMARKPGKLPGNVVTVDYGLEYGKNTLAMQKNAIRRGDTVLVIDDVLATGGSAKAAATLVEKLGGQVAGIHCVLELEGLNGREKLLDYAVRSQLQYK
ncbi:MAG TPA: purine phosphoribosyltransferase family protein, partial [Acidobacteriota bacterium]|nr:purine phosphoribosyltransferase family protein [Acidobacteriota bacterium]